MNCQTRVLLAPLLALLPLSACTCTDKVALYPHQVESFDVKVETIQILGTSTNVTYGPESDSWSYSQGKPLPMPKIGALMKVKVTALDETGQYLPDYQLPVSFRISPGHVIAAGTDYDAYESALMANDFSTVDDDSHRLMAMVDGMGEGWVLVEKVYGVTRVWAQDSPPEPTFGFPCQLDEDGNCVSDGGTLLPFDGGIVAGPDASVVKYDAGRAGPDAAGLDAGPSEPDGGRTYSSGVSEAIFFASPSLADLQKLPGKTLIFNSPASCPSTPEWDDTTSPFVNNFVDVIGAPPVADMIVTDISSEGFYITDKLSPPVADTFYTDDPSGQRTLPGTFGHMYVYTYNYPDGLYIGDRVLGVGGAVEEFSGDTQLVFPHWTRKVEVEPHVVDERPAPILIDFSITGDTCDLASGMACANSPAPANSLRCVPTDANGPCSPGQALLGGNCAGCSATPTDSCVPFGQHCNPNSGQCEGGCPATACPDGDWCVQHRCVKPDEPCPKDFNCPKGERCNAVTGACECGPSLGFRLSKTPIWYGQRNVPNEYTMFAYSMNNIEIESLESAIVKVVNARPSNTFIDCDHNGNSYVPNFAWMVPNFTAADIGQTPGCPNWQAQGWGCYDDGEDTVDCTCNQGCTADDDADHICTELTGLNNYAQWMVQLEDTFRTRMDVDTHDALPTFDPTIFADPQWAGCRMEITGVLRQVEASRPRWIIVARDETDVCCRVDPAIAGARCPTKDYLDTCPGCLCPKCLDAQQ